MVHVTTIHRRKVIGEKLQRHHFKDWQKQFRSGGEGDHLVRKTCDFMVAFSGDRNYPASATPHIFEDSPGSSGTAAWNPGRRVSRRE